MRMYRRSKRIDLKDTISLCNYDEDRGHVAMAVARLKDLEDEVGPDAKISYAEGLIRLQSLGQGMEAYRLFVRAMELDPKHVFAACNATYLAPTVEEFRKWAARAIKLSRGDAGKIQAILDRLDSGYPFHDFLRMCVIEAEATNDEGRLASRINLALSAGELTKEEEIELRTRRATCLLGKDLKSEQLLRRTGQSVTSSDRLALQEAIAELDKALQLDLHSSELLVIRSDCAVLMGEFEDALSFAKRAVELRPRGYPEAYLREAIAHRELGQRDAAQEAFEMAKEQAKSVGNAQYETIVNELIKSYESGLNVSQREHPADQIQRFVQSSTNVSQHLSGVMGATTRDLQKAFKMRLAMLGSRPAIHYVAAMGQLFSYVPAEMAFVFVNAIGTEQRTQGVRCFLAAIYITAHGEPVMKRDASRFLLLTVFRVAIDKHLTKGDDLVEAVCTSFHELITDFVALAPPSDKLRTVGDLVLVELARVSSELVRIVNSHPGRNESSIQRSGASIEEELSGVPFINDSSAFKSLSIMGCLIVIILSIVAVSWWYNR